MNRPATGFTAYTGQQLGPFFARKGRKGERVRREKGSVRREKAEGRKGQTEINYCCY
jgi:hypothetical protein